MVGLFVVFSALSWGDIAMAQTNERSAAARDSLWCFVNQDFPEYWM
jgi:hypothetical protein